MTQPDRHTLAAMIAPDAFERAAIDRAFFAARGEPDRVSPWVARAVVEAYAAADRVGLLLALTATSTHD